MHTNGQDGQFLEFDVVGAQVLNSIGTQSKRTALVRNRPMDMYVRKQDGYLGTHLPELLECVTSTFPFRSKLRWYPFANVLS